ncbi:response regulator transcription factor [Egicoccus sp. AB-alg2]|uniref:response regulator transcription factor n=1 Tax=Egicoccus sp. AB-alg2 TaxID=3242693 RepID=UPI00359DAF43
MLEAIEPRAEVLIVGDRQNQPTLRARLADRFAAEGLDLLSVAGPETALRRVAVHDPDVVIVRVSREGAATQALRQLRQHTSAPILALLGPDAREDERILVLDLGADDVLVEPVSALEIAAHSRALLRRGRILPAPTTYRYGPLEIDVAAREALLHDERIVLTHQEFNLLVFFASHPRQAFTRRELLEQAWEATREHNRGTVTEHVRRLRRKFDLAGEDGARWIATVHGVGYRFDPPR